MIPQIIFIAFVFIEIGYTIVKHGKQKERKFNATNTTIAWLIIMAILYCGGFFNCFIGN